MACKYRTYIVKFRTRNSRLPVEVGSCNSISLFIRSYYFLIKYKNSIDKVKELVASQTWNITRRIDSANTRATHLHAT